MVKCPYAWVAQLVEHSPEEGRVAGSIPAPSTVNGVNWLRAGWEGVGER